MAPSSVTGTPAWLLVTQAVDGLWTGLPANERQLAEKLAKAAKTRARAGEDKE